eukprot:TRINITY_DN46058_c0_g1_i1.p1 TRINITY_DN46058_c0_g1~~TRINITY_DN46058_c0_g1_i1.p1  ORF type:complete len:286 (+),score=55.36 TRINITY_DN46058_c0_g1_i1:55-858(+)
MAVQGIAAENRMQRIFYKTKICKFWQQRKCKRGESCKYAHGDVDQLQEPNLTKTALCRKQIAGGKCTDPTCSFAHSINELRSTDDLYKTGMCRHFLQKGRCRMGSDCRHAHGIHELRSADGQALMSWWNMPFYYPEHVPDPSGSLDFGLLETPTETATSSEMASCIDLDDASDPGTPMISAHEAAQEGTAMIEAGVAFEGMNRVSTLQCTQPAPIDVPREHHSSLRPTIFSRRWKDEEDEEDNDDKEAEAIGKFLMTVRKLSRAQGL